MSHVTYLFLPNLVFLVDICSSILFIHLSVYIRFHLLNRGICHSQKLFFNLHRFFSELALEFLLRSLHLLPCFPVHFFPLDFPVDVVFFHLLLHLFRDAFDQLRVGAFESVGEVLVHRVESSLHIRELEHLLVITVLDPLLLLLDGFELVGDLGHSPFILHAGIFVFRLCKEDQIVRFLIYFAYSLGFEEFPIHVPEHVLFGHEN